MKFGNYTVESLPELIQSGVCFGNRDGKRYRIWDCGESRDSKRKDILMKVLNRGILPNSNVLVPDVFKVEKRYYSADVCGDDEVLSCPSSAICVLGAGHRRRLILSAVSAVASLERAGIVHGNLEPNCFRISKAKDGSLYMRLIGLGQAGVRNKMMPTRDRVSIWTAPGRGEFVGDLHSSEDTYALGLCIHFWLTGELPVWADISTRQNNLLSDQISDALLPVIGMMLAPRPNNRPLPSAVLQMLSGEVIAQVRKPYKCYPGGRYSMEYEQNVIDAFLKEAPTCNPIFESALASEMHW